MKNRRDIPKFILWLQKYFPRLRELIRNARFHETVTDVLCRMADEGTFSRCPSQLRFSTDCPTLYVCCETKDIVRVLARERSTFRAPRFFDIDQEILWQWFCEHDGKNYQVATYDYKTTTLFRDSIFEVLKSGAATLECQKCNECDLRAEYFEMAKGEGFVITGWVTTNSVFRCPKCHSSCLAREDRTHYNYPKP